MTILPSDFNVRLAGNHLAQIHGDLAWCHSTRKEEVRGNRRLDWQALMLYHLFAARVSSCSIPPVLSQPFFLAPPLNLANSPSLHLLTPAEQALCSQLRILPKPYLVIKETLVREYARRGGKLRRREARDLVKIDVNKTSRVWDFLVQSGYLKITNDQSIAASSVTPSVSQSQDARYVDWLPLTLTSLLTTMLQRIHRFVASEG